MSDILSHLNEAQQQAAACTEGPVMIIAGAGSGKTRTLTYRIAHLIDMGVNPFQILSLTFTKKAANEMRERIEQLVGPKAKNIWMGTFHSVFAHILRSEAEHLGYTRNFTIFDTDDSKNAIKQIVKQLNLDPKTYKPNVVLSRISMAKSSLLLPGDYAQNPEVLQTDTTAHRPLIAEIYKLYNKRLHNSNAMDFDDLLVNMNILFRDCPDVLLKYQEKFKYILVDEYQDTNYSQYLIVKKLAARHRNLCVVGDDAQSIYAFRGANIENILNFKRDYPDMKLFKLEQNYRSTQNIVNAANSIIENNERQIKKEVWTANGSGNRIRLVMAHDEREEGKIIADSIKKEQILNDIEYKDFAILYRTNSQSRSIEEGLRKLNIPYHIYQGTSFYSRKEVKDILCYLRLVVNNHDDESLLRIINYPARGIGQTTLDKIQTAAADNDVSIWTVLENLPTFALPISNAIVDKINQFVTSIRRFTAQRYTTDAYTLARQITLATGIVRMLREEEDPDNAARIENIEELLNGVKEFCEQEDDITPGWEQEDNQQQQQEGFRTLDMFLQQVLLLTTEDKEKENPNRVSLMTIHAAKGLEFAHVYVAGMEENLFPSALCLGSQNEIEEERRLFYVAVTRAKEQLTLSYANSRYQNGSQSFQEISRFVEEIDSRYIEMPVKRSSNYPSVGSFTSRSGHTTHFTQRTTGQNNMHLQPRNDKKGPATINNPADIEKIQVGMRVKHFKFGNGKVLSLEMVNGDKRAIVFFETEGQKTLILKYAKLEIITD